MLRSNMCFDKNTWVGNDRERLPPRGREIPCQVWEAWGMELILGQLEITKAILGQPGTPKDNLGCNWDHPGQCCNYAVLVQVTLQEIKIMK